MIVNLKKAARDRNKIMIGGGEFGPADFRLAAHMMECYPLMLEALRQCEATLYGLDDDYRIHRAWSRARAAIRTATKE